MKIRPIWLLNLAAIALLAAAPQLPAAEDEDDEIPDADAEAIPIQDGFAVRYFDQVVFGKEGEGRADAVRGELNLYLREKIAALDFVCDLNETQRQRLQLAGRGDIKRLLDRVDD